MKADKIENRLNPRVILLTNSNLVAREMLRLGCTPKGIRIMLPKAQTIAVKLHNLTRLECNIIKQGMLSVGADVAVHKDVVTEGAAKSDVVIVATANQYSLALPRFLSQPWKIPQISKVIEKVIQNSDRKIFKIKHPGGELTLGKETLVMGILNVTQDSFYDGGKYLKTKDAIAHGMKMIDEGADIIDVGGESTRPGSLPIKAKVEIERVIPVINVLARKGIVSVDTYKPEVAEAAIQNGAVIINSIIGVSKSLAQVASRNKTPVVIMHIKGRPKNMQDDPQYSDLISEITSYLREQIALCAENGIDEDKTIIDPGIGFGKRPLHNTTILKRLEEFRSLGRPILIGPSRKSFIGHFLNAEKENRLNGTLTSVSWAASNGADIVRVHDVKPAKEAVKLLYVIKTSNY